MSKQQPKQTKRLAVCLHTHRYIRQRASLTGRKIQEVTEEIIGFFKSANDKKEGKP